MRCLTILTAFVAVAIGLILYDKTLMLKVPYGYIPYLLLTPDVPPFMDAGVLQKCTNQSKCPWLKESVTVDACAKCGTNWVMTIVHELRTWDREDLRDFDDILDIAPWLEMKMYPEEDRNVEDFEWGSVWNNSGLKFPLFKSHLPAFLVPVKERQDAKFIVVVRNVEDSMASFAKFIQSFSPESEKLWSKPQFPNVSLEELMFAFKVLGNFPTSAFFLKDWWEFKDLPNVLLLHYSDLTKAPRENIKKIADFIGLKDIPEAAIDRVLERTSVDFMKKHNSRYSYMVGKNRDVPLIMSKVGLIQKGGVGRGSKKLTEEHKQLLRKHSESLLPEEAVKFLYFGDN